MTRPGVRTVVATALSLLGLGLGLGVWACSSGGTGDGRSETVREPVTPPRLPVSAEEFAPAETRLRQGSRLSGEHLSDIDTCATCHPDVVAQWTSSAHAWASFNNPVYRLSIEAFRAGVNAKASQFCAGCHDIALLIDNAMLVDVRPDDARAHTGVNCRVCHGVEETTNDGNGSFTLGEAPISLPDLDDAASVERHKEAASVRHLGSDLCVSCHRSFIGPATGNKHHLTGMDDALDWERSAHTGQGVGRVDSGVVQRDCVDCHMESEPASDKEMAATDGAISSHRFLGAHTWLAAMRSDAAQEKRIADKLANVASIDIAVALSNPPAPARVDHDGDDAAVAAMPALEATRSLPADGAVVHPGGQVSLDVVVRNLDVGHRFPGGVKDAQDVWIQVTVRDADERVIASSGDAHERDPRDTEAHVLRALVANDDGDILFAREVDRFRAVIVDHTIAPRDAAVVRYQFDVPDEAAGFQQPFSATAVLRHRSRNLLLQEKACADQETPLGRSFTEASQALRQESLDACRPQPVVDVATSRIWLGQGAKERPRTERADWQRLYEHGMAWNHAVQERLEEARPSLMAALDAVARDSSAGPRERAMVLTALGRLAGRQGRTDEALEWLDQAEALAPGVPAIPSIRGAALTQVWRWQEAEAPLTQAANAASGNSKAWADLAVALGSLGKSREALDAARMGLALEPRNGTLLRVQALSVRALEGPESERALDAYDRFRKTDQTTEVRFSCAARYAWCAREREPVHVHQMTPPGSTAP